MADVTETQATTEEVADPKADKKAAKKAEKEAKKEAKKAEKEARKEAHKNGEVYPGDDERLGVVGGLIMAFVVLLIILIWLVIFAFLVKMDVGGFGSTVLFPVLKDVPYVNQILPGIEDYIPQEEEEEIPYKTVEEAVVRIKELEVEIEQLKHEGSAYRDYIAELEAASQ